MALHPSQFTRVVLVAAVLLLLPSASTAVTLPDVWSGYEDQVYKEFGDFIRFNWRVMNIMDSSIEVPRTDTGSSTSLLRMFSNGNPNPTADLIEPVVWKTDTSGEFNPGQSAALWFGLVYDKHTDLITKLLTTDEVVGVVGNSPYVIFDQNQAQGGPANPPTDSGGAISQRADILLKGRLLLVDPTIPGGLGGFIGQDAAYVNSLISANPGKVKVFNYYDSVYTNFPDPGEPARPWAWHPGENGIWQLDSNGMPVLDSGGNPIILPMRDLAGNIVLDGGGNPIPLGPVNNNTEGSRADWGSYVIDPMTGQLINLENYPGWGFLVEVQAFYDNDGPEELYLMPGFAPFIIPEPLTIVASLLAVGATAGYCRRRLA